MKRACEACEWCRSEDGGEPVSGDLIVCRETPTPIRVSRSHWCGRFRIAERLIPNIGRLGVEDAVRLMRRPSDTLSTPETETANGPTRT